MVPGNNPGLIILPGEVAVAAELVIQQPFVKFLADCRMIPFHLWQSSNLSKITCLRSVQGFQRARRRPQFTMAALAGALRAGCGLVTEGCFAPQLDGGFASRFRNRCISGPGSVCGRATRWFCIQASGAGLRTGCHGSSAAVSRGWIGPDFGAATQTLGSTNINKF